MKNKILLINPKTTETPMADNRLLKLTGKWNVFPPIGLATIAGLTPSDFEVEIIDEDAQEIDFKKDCDIVGITGYSRHVNRMIEIATTFKTYGKLVVAGGIGAHVHSDLVIPFVDVLFLGECELTWPRFLKDWLQGKFQELYDGGNRTDLSQYVQPRWDLIDLKSYSQLAIQASRGCHFNCDYCDVVAIFGNQLRTKPNDVVMKELTVAVSYGVNEVFFTDDNFAGNITKTKELLKAIRDLNRELAHPIRFSTQATIDIAKDEELITLFKEANFYSLYIGIETSNMASLKQANKTPNITTDVSDAIKKIQSKGIYIVNGGMIGFDADKKHIFNQLNTYLTDNGLVVPTVAMLTARKGTRLWKRLELENRLCTDCSQDEFGVINFYPKHFSKEELEEEFMRFQKEILYLNSTFIERLTNFLNQIDKDFYQKHCEKKGDVKNLFLGIKIITFFLFHKSKEHRILIRKVLKLSAKYPSYYFPLIIELLVVFEYRREYIFSLQ
ncbi:MAG: B12-binding domain-containing radical SAM protein [Bacteroidales bacterium]|nr:B12-binding domain-containing radical SAM protein [Bacteroidales bacterium]